MYEFLTKFKRPFFISILALFVFLPWCVHAWPTTNQWIPVYKGGVFLQDDLNDASGSRNIVSDPNNDAAFIFNDGTYIYFRMRLDEDPSGGGGQGLLQPYGWGVMLDTNLNPGDYEWIIMADGIAKTEVIELWQNTAQGTLGSPSDKAEILYTSILLAGNYQVSVANTSFNGDPDYFLDWRFPWDTLKQASGLTDSSPIRLFFGSSNNASNISADLVGGSDLYTGFSDVITPLGATTGTIKFVADMAGNGDVIQVYAGDTLYLRVDDGDMNHNNASLQTVTVTLIATSGDTSELTLTETGVNTGIFTASIPTQSGAPVADDGILQVTPGATVSAEYIDGIDASYNQNQIRADSVWVILQEPAISLVKSADPEEGIPGQEIIYLIHYHNSGMGIASNLIIVDSIPFFTTYVAGSMRIGDAASTYDTAASLTDDAGDDAGQLSGNSVIFTISTVAADDGTANSDGDEGRVYFKTTID
ncbi:MAG: hypothetical protein JW882_11820 [Deltaproteobacteria bacterium]|nr:hypothetical protein [Deltaproteobacteria bacterium]